MKCLVTGIFDICTGVATTMNWIAKQFDCPIDYLPERAGDVKHLSQFQDPKSAFEAFGYKAEIPFNPKSLAVYLT